jgi:hypothetical protein
MGSLLNCAGDLAPMPALVGESSHDPADRAAGK